MSALYEEGCYRSALFTKSEWDKYDNLVNDILWDDKSTYFELKDLTQAEVDSLLQEPRTQELMQNARLVKAVHDSETVEELDKSLFECQKFLKGKLGIDISLVAFELKRFLTKEAQQNKDFVDKIKTEMQINFQDKTWKEIFNTVYGSPGNESNRVKGRVIEFRPNKK